MSNEEPYEIMPYSEVAELKKQLKVLQEKKTNEGEQLINSMTTLTRSMDSMLQLFKTAVDEMKIEEHEETALTENLKPLMDRLDEIVEQNKIIAEGMVAISDLIKEKFTEPEQKFPKMPPQGAFMDQPDFSMSNNGNMPPTGMPPPPGMPQYGPQPSMPPPPNMPLNDPFKPQKRGFFK
jgi:hypothetical protein